MSDAIAKAKLHRDAMRAAAAAGVSAQAQGLLGQIIAESWPVGTSWTAKLAFSILEERLSAHRASVKRWAEELEQCELVRRRSGSRGRITTWTVLVGMHGRTPGGAPVSPGGRASATCSGAPVHPTTDANISSGRATPTEPGGSSSLADETPRPETVARMRRLAGRGITSARDWLIDHGLLDENATPHETFKRPVTTGHDS